MTGFLSGGGSLAQQALTVAQEALTIIKTHKYDCERRDRDRDKAEEEREDRLESKLKAQDERVERLHKENQLTAEERDKAARARWFWTIGLLVTGLLTMVTTLAVYIIEMKK